jgi:hypothetical protein
MSYHWSVVRVFMDDVLPLGAGLNAVGAGADADRNCRIITPRRRRSLNHGSLYILPVLLLKKLIASHTSTVHFRTIPDR